MGKGVLVFSILTVVVLSTIILNVMNNSREIPGIVNTEEIQGGATSLSDYALNYAMKQVVDENVTDDKTSTFSNFEVLGGEINRLTYDFDFNSETDIIQLVADVSWYSTQDTINHRAEALLEFVPGSNIDPYKVGHWYFDEGSGDSADDFTENENEATAVNNSNPNSDWEDDRFTNEGQSMDFDNSFWSAGDEYYSVDEDPSLDALTEGSCEAWVKLEWPYIPFAGILHKGERANWTDEAYSLQFWSTGREAAFAVRNSSDQVQVVVGPPNLRRGRWYYIVGTWNASEVAVWVDGQKVASQANTIGAVRNSDGNLQIGSQLSNGNEHGYYNELFGFSGQIDDASVRNQAYSQDEIEMNYIEGSMAAYWQFEEGTGNQAFDSSRNANTGLLHDGHHSNGIDLPSWEDSKFGKGLVFNGFDNMVSVPNANSLTIKKEGTISFWANPYTLNSESGYLHKGDDKNFFDACYSFYNRNNSRKLYLTLYKRIWFFTTRKTVISNSKVNINSWNYLATTWDSGRNFWNRGHLSLYVNGSVVEKRNMWFDVVHNASHLNIGAKTREYKNSSLGNYGFDGIMDEVRIFFRKLETYELDILQDYDPTADGAGDGLYKIVYWDN
ncbi:MAG: LamG domain-containing protein [Candidatus Cloacimonadota bacterium]|nr:LamG domain-containing protein [Candidatus Cloacimonadota bacterium]